MRLSNINDPSGMELKPLQPFQGFSPYVSEEGPLLANLKGKLIAVPDTFGRNVGQIYNVEKDEWVG